MNFSDLFRIILKKKWLFIIIFFVGFFISVGYYKFSEKEYRATAKIRVQSDNSDFSFGSSILSSLAKDASGIDNELALIGSEEILRNTIEKTGFDKILGLSDEQAAGYIKKYLLSYESAGNNNFIDIYFTFKDREPAIDFLNAFISEYNNKYIEIYDKELYNKKAFLEERLGYYSNLYDLQKKSLEKYMNYENDISFQKSYVSGLLSKYMTETESLTLEKESYDYSLSQLKEKQDEFNYNYELENSFPDLVSVKKLIFDTELSLFDLKNKYSQDNSSVESLEARLEYLRTQYNKTLESAINNLGISSSAYTEFIKNSENIKMQREIAVMKTDYFSKRIDELKKEYSDISEDAFEYETVKALADYYSKMISQYKQKTEELYVSIGTSFSNIYTVDKPFAPSLPNLPSLKKTALFGGIATLFAAFFISYFSF
ncbi:MAG TPA: Wzz/FepE/Etk N-terminal domain-containing protein, partial [Tepiditoga sp.]|nr:Wzz/FepE/Etk N-terminal domain-containing protein [Tepiditoga sp.]